MITSLPVFLAEASSTNASAVVSFNFTTIISIFASMFVCINLLNTYVYKPLFQNIENISLEYQRKYTEEILADFNEDGQKKFQKLLKEAKDKKNTATIITTIFNLLSLLLWFIIMGYTISENEISRKLFMWIFGVFSFLTLICIGILVYILFNAKSLEDNFSELIKIGTNIPKKKRNSKGQSI